MNIPKYIDEREVAKITGFALSTLRNNRFKGEGISYVKVGRSVRYNLEDVVDVHGSPQGPDQHAFGSRPRCRGDALMMSKATIQSLPVRMGCSNQKGGDSHGGKQTLGSIPATTMNAVNLNGISMPEQIQAVPIGYHQDKKNCRKLQILKSHKTKTDRNCGHKEKTMKKDIFENETTQEQAPRH